MTSISEASVLFKRSRNPVFSDVSRSRTSGPNDDGEVLVLSVWKNGRELHEGQTWPSKSIMGSYGLVWARGFIQKNWEVLLYLLFYVFEIKKLRSSVSFCS